MKTKKYILLFLIISTIISLIWIVASYNCQNIVYDFSLGIFSSNIVAIVIILIEYYSEKETVLTSFIFESTAISRMIDENIDLLYLIKNFSNELIEDDEEVLFELFQKYILIEENQIILNKTFESLKIVKSIDTSKLAEYFNNYHSLLPRKKVNDKNR